MRRWVHCAGLQVQIDAQPIVQMVLWAAGKRKHKRVLFLAVRATPGYCFARWLSQSLPLQQHGVNWNSAIVFWWVPVRLLESGWKICRRGRRGRPSNRLFFAGTGLLSETYLCRQIITHDFPFFTNSAWLHVVRAIDRGFPSSRLTLTRPPTRTGKVRTFPTTITQ